MANAKHIASIRAIVESLKERQSGEASPGMALASFMSSIDRI